MMFNWRIPHTMKSFWMIFVITALLLSACGSEPEPTLSPADVQSTAMAAAMTMVAETQAAVPTATPLPPTEPPTATPFPTNTLPPVSFETPTLASLAQTQTVGVLPTITSAPTSSSSGSNDPCNKPLTVYAGESAKLKIANNTKPRGPLTVSLYVNTLMGECGYISARFQNSGSMTVPLGHYTAWAIVDSTKPFTAGTTFSIMSTGNYQLDVQQESVYFRAGCAPNC